MNRLLFGMFGLMVGMGINFAEAKKVDLLSKIDAVTVYKDSALVHRKKVVQLEKGRYRLEFLKLPIGLIEDSVKISGKGSSNSKILGIRIEKYELKRTETVNVDTLNSALKELNDAIVFQNGLSAIVSKKREYLNKLIAKVTDSISTPKNTYGYTDQKYKNTLEFYASQMTAMLKQEQEIKNRIQIHEEGIEKIRKKIRKQTYGRGKENKKVIVDLEVENRGQIRFKLSYRINGAYWKPFYNLRLSSTDKTAILESSAIISQRTGEDWNQVRISLSNSKPIQLDKMPTLKPILLIEYKIQHGNLFGIVKTTDGHVIPGAFVILSTTGGKMRETLSNETGRFQFKSIDSGKTYSLKAQLEGFNVKKYRGIRIRAGYENRFDIEMQLATIQEQIVVEGKAPTIDRQSPTGTSALDLDFLSSVPGIKQSTSHDLSFYKAAVSQSNVAVAYTLKHRDSFRSDNQEKKVVIAGSRPDFKLERVTIPLKSNYCYIKADVRNLSESRLVGGLVNIFYDGALVNKTMLSKIGAGQILEIPVAVDQTIQINRTIAETQLNKRGFLKKKQLLNQGYRIKVENHDSREKALVLFDRIPVSRDKKIEVTDIEIHPKAAKIKDNGIIRWELKLKAGERREISVRYTVIHPRDIKISKK